MCNLYSVTKGQQAIRELSNAMRDMTGKTPAMRMGLAKGPIRFEDILYFS